MKSKENVSDEDINEMIAEYKGFSIGAPKDGNQEPSIIYKGTKRKTRFFTGVCSM